MTITLITRMKQKMDMGAFGLQPNPVKSYGLGIGGGGYSGGVMDVMPHFTPPPHVMPPHAPTNPHTVTAPTSKLLPASHTPAPAPQAAPAVARPPAAASYWSAFVSLVTPRGGGEGGGGGSAGAGAGAGGRSGDEGGQGGAWGLHAASQPQEGDGRLLGDGRVREEGVTEADAMTRVLEALDPNKRVLLVQPLAVRGNLGYTEGPLIQREELRCDPQCTQEPWGRGVGLAAGAGWLSSL
jgi:hypothetical protein